LGVSTDSQFNPIAGSSATVLTTATITGLAVNTTYYLDVITRINGSSSTAFNSISTATLATVPLTLSSTWTVYVTSLTMSWSNGSNPSNTTRYVVELSTAIFPNNFVLNTVSITYNITAMFVGLDALTTYYAQVKAVNHSNIDTGYLVLGSTLTGQADLPQNPRYTDAGTAYVTVAWNAPTGGADSYILRVSSNINFTAPLSEQTTVGFTDTVSALEINTTYYARVAAVVGAATSPFTTVITTATHVTTPVTLSSTWTMVGISSITMAWSNGFNPVSVTKYEVEISTVNDFTGTNDQISYTYNLNSTFTGLLAEVVYYGQVRALNHREVPSAYLVLGSTQTRVPNAPTNIHVTTATSTSITAAIIKDEAADKEFGSGVMTITPAHSGIDFEIAQRHGLDIEPVIDERGILLAIAGEFAGQHIKKARPMIVEKLQAKGLVTRIEENYVHNVATNSRGGGVIEPQIKKQWFVAVNKEFTIPHSEIPGIASGSTTTLKALMRASVESGAISIAPDRFEKVYYHWIDNLRDWNISRQIWFGHRIPAWFRGDEVKVQIDSPGADWVQDEDVLDTWFSSGLWTFSTLGWPTKVNREGSGGNALSWTWVARIKNKSHLRCCLLGIGYVKILSLLL
jgi:hypothetical protein